MNAPRLYTKLGDDGSTGLLFGGRVSKADPLIATIGSIDEAVATLGLARASGVDATLNEMVLRVQRDLFVVAADLIANPNARERLKPEVSLVTSTMTTRVERTIDCLVEERPLRRAFIVPGANPISAALDLARAVVRRAERDLIAYQVHAAQPINPEVRNYLNRLSDLLFTLARRAAGGEEEPLSHTPAGSEGRGIGKT